MRLDPLEALRKRNRLGEARALHAEAGLCRDGAGVLEDGRDVAVAAAS